MSVDTKGVVLTREKNPSFVIKRVMQAIETLMADPHHEVAMRELMTGETLYRGPTFENEDYSGSLPIYFTYEGQRRMVFVHTQCDGDLTEEFGEGTQGIILSIGCWGYAVKIMHGILTQLSDMGECYMDQNDCDEHGYLPIGVSDFDPN